MTTRRRFITQALTAGIAVTALSRGARSLEEGASVERAGKPDKRPHPVRQKAGAAPLLICGAALIDGTGAGPRANQSILIERGRIKAIGPAGVLGVPSGARVMNAEGRYIIPGLMNANVHLLAAFPQSLMRYWGRFEELIAEAAQVALKNGLTTVFDTAGPRRFLMAVRDRINRGELPGSRIFCAGNIIGFDGPFSEDFDAGAGKVAGAAYAKRINSIWVENVGRHLMWQTPDEVAQQVRAYVAKGIDFLKYAANDHRPGAFLAFSPPVQKAIVEEAHRAGLSAQAHTMSVEGLRIALEAGCDLITHCNLTGPTAIPETTLAQFVERDTGAVIFPMTDRGLAWQAKNSSDMVRTVWAVADINTRNLMRCGARLLLANDGAVVAAETMADPSWQKMWGELMLPEAGGLYNLGEGHFGGFKAMEEKGCEPMRMLQAATREIAVAYGKAGDLGTVEPGKIADLLILDKNPLQAAANYRSIHAILKDGAVVDRAALPRAPALTRPPAPVEEEASYVPFLS